MSDITNGQNICPNCNTELKGEFCYECGQKKIHHPETVGHFVRHFFDDVTHFDSKFFKSLLPLFFKPGFITKEYMAGRRARYLHPIRAYLFLSFVYFFLFFSFDTSSESLMNAPTVSTKDELELDSLKRTSLEMSIAIDSINSDSKNIEQLIDSLKKTDPLVSDILDSLKYDNPDFVVDPINIKSKSKVNIDTISLRQYDELQRQLPDSLRDSWLYKMLIRRSIVNRDKYHGDAKAIWQNTVLKLIQNIPKILFFILPIFALLLKMLYARKKILYVAHAIFSLHYFSFLFILFSLSIILQGLVNYKYGSTVVLILVIFYLYKAIRNFYPQSRVKSLIKLFILTVTFSIVILVAFVISIIISFLSL